MNENGKLKNKAPRSDRTENTSPVHMSEQYQRCLSNAFKHFLKISMGQSSIQSIAYNIS